MRIKLQTKKSDKQGNNRLLLMLNNKNHTSHINITSIQNKKDKCGSEQVSQMLQPLSHDNNSGLMRHY